MTRRTITVQVTAEVDEGGEADFVSRLADAAEHEAGAYWAYATLGD
jgi:hypothetical protein